MNQEKIGKFIAELRKEKNMTQEQLAERLGVSNKSISRWENGVTMPDYSLLNEICGLLDININELMSGEKIEKENYITKAEENFITLKRKVDRVCKILNIAKKTIYTVTLILLIIIILQKQIHIEILDTTNVKYLIRTMTFVNVIGTIFLWMLDYEVKK